ncbi:MAG: 2-hydroxyacid dehydrogenase [Desulfobacterales bacterium]|nr:2-hydroxyacid dehydrogenase [Desulfobacterales bacterium]MDD4072091.1 2-hydroxyacid dehydrogenase [Desulfobacterales bacterium]MDD4393484.1 2-hydroxyacid dehydrogenase [Desulfobacterales bacterium]
MNILFAASENAWGGFLNMIRAELPRHQFEATGRFGVDHLTGVDVLIPTMCPVTEALLEKSDCLRLIQQCGSGIEGVDLQAARKRNIRVANVPTDISGNADSVAELGIYMMIGLSRNIRGMAQSLENRKMGEPQGRALSGLTVGLAGLGGIGKALIRRLRAFDVHLIGIKHHGSQQAMQELDLEWVGGAEDLHILLKRSDVVMLCLPCTAESKYLINRSSISWMKENAYLINLSRGGLVERDALAEALASGRLAGAGLDVFWEEPPDPDDPIFKYNVLATPHIAGSTDVSMRGIVRAVAENIRRVEKNQEPLYVKN